MNKKILIFGIFLLFSLSFISAQTSNAYCVNNGMSLIYKDQPTIKQGNTFEFSFHIGNSSNGAPLDNLTSFCALHVYNSSGQHIITENQLNFGINNYDFYLTTNESTFMNIGEYSFVVGCFDYDFTISASCSDSFEVTPNGKIFTVQNSISYLGFIFIFLLVFGLTLYGAITIKWNHPRDSNNIVLQANNLRYVKIFLFSMSYVLMMFLFGLSYKFFNEAGIEGFNNFFYFTYQLFESLLYPIIITTIIIFVIIFLTNKKITENIKLGI
jgi:hypothetical protein